MRYLLLNNWNQYFVDCLSIKYIVKIQDASSYSLLYSETFTDSKLYKFYWNSQ